MDGRDGNANGDRAMLERIVALLLALAGLADRAAALPFLHRRRVLAILGRGEAAARTLLTGMAPDATLGEDARYEDDAPADVPVGDALRLAARFRALALVLATFLAHAIFSAPSCAAGPCAGGREPVRQACRQATSPAPDTS